jgi:hypothetical protein
MGSFTRDNTDLAIELDGFGKQHRTQAGDMFVALEQWKAGLDTGPMFADLPGGACSEPHWGYCVEGSVTVRFDDGEDETIRAGEAYYIRPGHNVHIDEDSELVEFTRADETPGINTVAG